MLNNSETWSDREKITSLNKELKKSTKEPRQALSAV